LSWTLVWPLTGKRKISNKQELRVHTKQINKAQNTTAITRNLVKIKTYRFKNKIGTGKVLQQ
jgi:hypothetical protein